MSVPNFMALCPVVIETFQTKTANESHAASMAEKTINKSINDVSKSNSIL